MNSWLNLPNALTLARIAILPLIFWFWRNNQPTAAGVCAGLGALTDFFDGRLARAWKQATDVGAILDPVSDKIMVMALFGLLAYSGVIPIWIFYLSSLRNISQLLSIPILIGWKKIAFKVRPAFIPKFASGLSFAIIVTGLLAGNTTHGSPSYHFLYRTLFLSSAVLGALEIQILVNYWPRFFQILSRRHDTFE